MFHKDPIKEGLTAVVASGSLLQGCIDDVILAPFLGHGISTRPTVFLEMNFDCFDQLSKWGEMVPETVLPCPREFFLKHMARSDQRRFVGKISHRNELDINAVEVDTSHT